jgi:stage III sporulation protein AB
MLLKGLGIGTVFLASAIFGYLLSFDYVTRLKNLEQIEKMLLHLKGEIKYNNEGIVEGIMKIAKRMDGIPQRFLMCIREYFNQEECSLKDAWDRGISEVLEPESKLGAEDILVIRELGNSLGITDRETQIQNLLNTMELLELKRKELNEGKVEKCRLYRTLGVMAGMFMAIVLI